MLTRDREGSLKGNTFTTPSITIIYRQSNSVGQSFNSEKPVIGLDVCVLHEPYMWLLDTLIPASLFVDVGKRTILVGTQWLSPHNQKKIGNKMSRAASKRTSRGFSLGRRLTLSTQKNLLVLI